MEKIIIEKIDKNGEVVKKFSSVIDAAKEAGVSVTTVSRQINGQKFKTHCGYTWRRTIVDNTNVIGKKRPIVMLDENNNLLGRYDSIKECSKKTDYTISKIVRYLLGTTDRKWFTNRYKVKFMYAEHYDESDHKVESKTAVADYWINVLVGLVNRTLTDGATYTLNGVEYKYKKEKDQLVNETLNSQFSRDYFLQTVEIVKPLLTEGEKQFLKSLLKALKDVHGIVKCKGIYEGTEFIRLENGSPFGGIDLDTFKQGTYYCGLQLGKYYSIEELNLKGE